LRRKESSVLSATIAVPAPVFGALVATLSNLVSDRFRGYRRTFPVLAQVFRCFPQLLAVISEN